MFPSSHIFVFWFLVTLVAWFSFRFSPRLALQNVNKDYGIFLYSPNFAAKSDQKQKKTKMGWTKHISLFLVIVAILIRKYISVNILEIFGKGKYNEIFFKTFICLPSIVTMKINTNGETSFWLSMQRCMQVNKNRQILFDVFSFFHAWFIW